MMKNQTMMMHQFMKEEYDIWAMKMEHYLEYIENEVWKVIQNGNSKKRISTGKDGVVRILSPIFAPSESTKKTGKRRKQIARKGLHSDKTDEDAMLKDITRDDLTELYRIVMNRYGMNGPEDELEKVNDARDKKLQGGKPDEDCYKMLKMMEKQAGIRK
ncbi:hypothetical protein Tco_0024488 [Tanacetum coccineum]